MYNRGQTKVIGWTEELVPDDQLSPPLQRSRLSVLIADDVLETRRMTRIMLASNPLVAVVGIANNGIQAIKKAQALRPDIVIMDIHMPGLDGLSAIYAIQEYLPEAVFLVISADRDEQTIQDAQSLGAVAYLTKPFTADQLDHAIERAARVILQQRKRKNNSPTAPTRQVLQAQAVEVIRAARTDQEAMAILERLAADPACEMQWLSSLALIYVARMEWGKLKLLAARLEKMEKE